MSTGSLHEHSFNTQLGLAMTICANDQRLKFRSERRGLFKSVSARADVFVDGERLLPVVIEGEYDKPGTDPDSDAKARLGMLVEHKNLSVSVSATEVLSSVAVKYPAEAETWAQADVVDKLLSGKRLSYAVHERVDGSDLRWPPAGFMEDDVRSLTELVVALADPRSRARDAAAEAANYVDAIANFLNRELTEDGQAELSIAVGRPSGLDATRICAIVWLNSFLFHDIIVTMHPIRGLRKRDSTRIVGPIGNKIVDPRKLFSTWNAIRRVNYRSIYDTAVEALTIVENHGDIKVASEALTHVYDAADAVQLSTFGLFDMGGEIYQRVLGDRDDAASYYTRSDIADFLARMAVDASWVPPKWAHAEGMPPDNETAFRIGDFACGTGILLRAAYRRVRSKVSAAGATPRALNGLHRHLMEKGFCGVDIQPVAANLTASSLSNMVPHVGYSDTNIGVVRVGGPNAMAGSLEFLAKSTQQDLFSQDVASASSIDAPANLYAPDDGFDVVLMNPPYQRARGGQKQFNVAGVKESERRRVVRKAQRLVNKTPANLQAGLATVFCEIARQKTRPGGRVGLVLPMTAASAPTWESTRRSLEESFENIRIACFSAGAQGGKQSMSADTHMGEMLFAGTKRQEPNGSDSISNSSDSKTSNGSDSSSNGSDAGKSNDNSHAEEILYIILDGAFRNVIDSAETALAVESALRLRGQQTEGRIFLGSSVRGTWRLLEPHGGAPWSLVGAADAGVVLLVERLIRNSEFHPLSAGTPTQIPITTIGELFEVGPTHHRIGHLAGNEPIGGFQFYPQNDDRHRKDEALWAADAVSQTTISTKPTHFGFKVGPRLEAAADKAEKRARSGNGGNGASAAEICKARSDAKQQERARYEQQIAELHSKRSKLLYQRNMRWTSQRLLAAYVAQRPVHGGRAWASLSHKDDDVLVSMALYVNSSLGMAVHWTRGQRQQSGRSTTQIEAIKSMPCPDFSHPKLRQSAAELVKQSRSLLEEELRPANQSHTDPARRLIDRAVAELLGVDASALSDLADNWCQEPSVKGV